MTDDAELRERTKRTARMLFHSITGGVGYEMWRKFDRGLARELSMVVEALDVYAEVLRQRGEPFPADEA